MKLIPGPHPRFKEWLEELPYIELQLRKLEDDVMEIVSSEGRLARAGKRFLNICRLEEVPELHLSNMKLAMRKVPYEPMVNLLAGNAVKDPNEAVWYYRRAMEYAERFSVPILAAEAVVGFANTMVELGKPKVAWKEYERIMADHHTDTFHYRLIEPKLLWALGRKEELEALLFGEDELSSSFQYLNRLLFLLEHNKDEAQINLYMEKLVQMNPIVLRNLAGKSVIPEYAGRYWIGGGWTEARMYVRYYQKLWSEPSKLALRKFLKAYPEHYAKIFMGPRILLEEGGRFKMVLNPGGDG